MTRRAVLSPNKQKVYQFIKAYKKAHDGNSPTIREIGDGCGINSTSTVRFYLCGLERLGLIRRSDVSGRTRAIEVVGGKWIAPSEQRAVFFTSPKLTITYADVQKMRTVLER